MLPRLQAERQLSAIEAAAMPWMKAETQQRAFGRLSRIAAGDGGGQGERTARSLHEALQGISMRVETVPANRGTSRDKTRGR